MELSDREHDLLLLSIEMACAVINSGTRNFNDRKMLPEFHNLYFKLLSLDHANNTNKPGKS